MLLDFRLGPHAEEPVVTIGLHHAKRLAHRDPPIEDLPGDFAVSAEVLTIDQVEDLYARKWYKKWWVWSLVGLGVVGTGLTIYVVKKRRRGRR